MQALNRQVLHRLLHIVLLKNSLTTTWKSNLVRNISPSFPRFKQTGSKMPYQNGNRDSDEQIEKLKKRLIWVDLEMTGLDVNTCHILEMACLVTDENLNIVAEGPNLIINQPNEVLDGMNPWCVKHHGESGLTEAVKKSKMSLQEAEYTMLGFVREHSFPGYCPLAGNTIHMDQRFLDKYMPQFMKHLHYRIVDVSTLKELCRRWYPEEFKKVPQKAAAHRALDDIIESIKEMKFYRETIFK